MAIREMLVFLNIDLEEFFDNVPRDKRMSLVHNIINDGDAESLIRKYLKAGVMVQGRYVKTERGTPYVGGWGESFATIVANNAERTGQRVGEARITLREVC